MARLTHSDVSRVLAAIQQVHSHTDFSTLPHLMVELQSQLIPADISSYTLMDKRTNQADVVGVEENLVEKLLPALMAHYHEHPIVQHSLKTKDLNAVKVTDFLKQKQFERTGYYNEFFKHLELRYQLIYYMFNHSGAELSMQLSSGVKDFSERDRAIANLLRPHFAQAYNNAKAFAELRQWEMRTQDALQSNSVGLMFLTGELKVERMTGNCERWLNDYFARRQNTSVQLPDKLQRWVEQQRDFQNADAALGNTRPPLVVEGLGASLVVRFVQDAGRNVTLLLSEQRKSMTPRFQPIPLLSARENEVLKWMVEGKRNGEIGSILNISERTVEKHVAEIFACLQVENRATAIVRAMERNSEASC